MPFVNPVVFSGFQWVSVDETRNFAYTKGTYRVKRKHLCQAFIIHRRGRNEQMPDSNFCLPVLLPSGVRRMGEDAVSKQMILVLSDEIFVTTV